MSSDFKQRSVVSSFICTAPHPQEGLKFALFKRSREVSTYKGKWAVCSGSIEPRDFSPQAAAAREILEETQLSGPGDITLLRRGKPFKLTDQALRTEWTIHPFLWQLKHASRASRIKLDWEHTEVRFIEPEELSSYDHVPQLELGLGRVLVSAETERGLSVLRDDHETGAQALAVKALEILLSMVRGDEIGSSSTAEEFWREVRWRAWHLAKNGRPSTGAAIEAKLFRALDLVSRRIQASESQGTVGVPLPKLQEILESVLESNIAEGKGRKSRDCLTNLMLNSGTTNKVDNNNQYSHNEKNTRQTSQESKLCVPARHVDMYLTDAENLELEERLFGDL